MVYGVNSLERHNNKRGPSAENRLSPGTELLFPFYIEKNYIAELEQKKKELQKRGGRNTKSEQTCVFPTAAYQVALHLPYILYGFKSSCQASNLCRLAHRLFIRWLKRTNVDFLVMLLHVLA
jgi:hypothetical protein